MRDNLPKALIAATRANINIDININIAFKQVTSHPTQSTTQLPASNSGEIFKSTLKRLINGSRMRGNFFRIRRSTLTLQRFGQSIRFGLEIL